MRWPSPWPSRRAYPAPVRRFFLLVLVLAAAVPARAQAPAEQTLAADAVVAGVAVGGLDRAAARTELERRLSERYEQPVLVRVRGRRNKLPTKRLGLRI